MIATAWAGLSRPRGFVEVESDIMAAFDEPRSWALLIGVGSRCLALYVFVSISF